MLRTLRIILIFWIMHKAIKNSIENVNDTINKTRNDCRNDAGKTSAIFQ